MLHASQLFNFKKKHHLVGVSENNVSRCLLWHQEQQPVCIWQAQQDNIMEVISQFPFSYRNLQFVQSIPHTYIWRKVLYFPMMESNLLYKHIIDSFKHELPTQLTETYFDYSVEPHLEQNRIKVSLFALRRNYADSLKMPQNTIIDCQLHCYLRGFDYLLPDIQRPIIQNCYEMTTFTFQYQQDELQINPESPNMPKYHINELCLPKDVLDKELYLSALGASLWSGKE